MTDHPKPIAPEEIYLQFHGDSSEDGPVDLSDVTWSAERVYARDVRYVNEAALAAKDARIAELEEGNARGQAALDEVTLKCSRAYRVNEALRAAIEELAVGFDADAETLVRDFQHDAKHKRLMADAGSQALKGCASELRALLEKKP
jgi:hypothetical protein